MRLKIEIEINELKDGEFLAKLGDKVLGDAGSIDPVKEVNRVYDLITVKEYIGKLDFLGDKAPELRKEFNNAIREKLALLLAYYYIEED
jgi:hypothetical protein